MSLSTLPLSYCTNVHPGKNIDQVVQGLREYTIPARRQIGERIAAGLWLPASALAELRQHPDQKTQLRTVLAEGDLVCYTLNTFPFGDFHSDRVKENVYVPDWTEERRYEYTRDSAELLGELMPDGVEGSLSTVPLGFKGFDHPADFFDRCCENLIRLAKDLDRLHDETGRVLRLAIEPEPLCLLETTGEAIEFFQRLFSLADGRGIGDIVRRHVGLCYDVCHQAVEFEDIEESVRAIDRAGIRINKVHLTCALHLDKPMENGPAREQLAEYVEQRYLHQTFAKSTDGQVHRFTDLTVAFCENPPREFLSAEAWRIHFHVPVHREDVGLLKTTRPELEAVLKAVHRLDYAPHLEVETYTWGVLPEEERLTLTDGLTRELQATHSLVRDCRSNTER
ncbi:MAG: metabolite traffic protein EboE [Planctomycetaceae bacterium]|nr:metabolite traffic protein EboE [Planctomycetaceae bacterium]